jgi:hypothetical protein
MIPANFDATSGIFDAQIPLEYIIIMHDKQKLDIKVQ